MILSDHAKEEMFASEISYDEIALCIEHGELEFEHIIHGETRYGKSMDFKEKSIIVVYTYREEETRIITCYERNRKKWQ